METRRLALYFGVSNEVIGVRESLHDWQEGDVIVTDGEKTEIYAIFDSTLKNMLLMAALFTELNTKTSMWCLQGFEPHPADEDEMWDNKYLLKYTDFYDLLSVMVCNQFTVRKRQWPDYEKRLDLMEEVVEQIA